MPYLEINRDNQTEENIKEKIKVPRIVGMTITEAEKVLKEYELELQFNEEIENLDKQTAIIKEQLPINGIEIYKGSHVSVTIE